MTIATTNTTNTVRAPRLPSSVLVVMGVLSFFLATLAFASALSQAGSVGFFVIPGSIGFITTIPYYVILYSDARKRTQEDEVSVGGLSLMSLLVTPSPIHIFILAALWAVIFFVDILFCVGTGPGVPVGIILSTIIAGIEWMVLLFIALKGTKESWNAEKISSHTAPHHDDNVPAYEDRDEGILHLKQNSVPRYASRYIYLVSFILATMALVFSISISFSCLVNVLAFFLTGPYHISVFVLSGSPRQSSALSLPHSINIVYILLLVVAWSCAVVIDTVSYGYLFQGILSAIFGGIECIIIGYIAICCILEGLAPRENQIQLPADA